MFSAVASGIFAARNVDKTANGDVGRSAVALGQTAGLVQEIAKYDNAVAKGARSALSVFSDLAKENKAFGYASKATKFAVNNVNPLICASGVLKTAMSDDKVKTGISETFALSAMFMAEACVKHNYGRVVNSSTFKNAVSKASDSSILKPVVKFLEKHKLKGKLGLLLKGLTFVAVSMSAYSAGQNIGNDVADNVKAGLKIPKKINQKA